MTTHHLSDELLEDYVRGRLSQGWSVGVATHLALCPTCRRRADHLEALGGALLDEIEPAAVEDDALANVLSRLAEQRDDSIEVSPHDVRQHPVIQNTSPPVLPQPLRGIVGDNIEGLKWRRLNGDVAQFVFETGDDSTVCRLLRVKAGRPVAEHSHGGMEMTLVLQGSFSDELGTFSRGDVELTDETTEHQPVAGVENDCICLAITDAPLKFRNPVVRLLQPFFRI